MTPEAARRAKSLQDRAHRVWWIAFTYRLRCINHETELFADVVNDEDERARTLYEAARGILLEGIGK